MMACFVSGASYLTRSSKANAITGARLTQRRPRLRVHLVPRIARRCNIWANAAGAGAGVSAAGGGVARAGAGDEGRLRVPGAGPSAEYLCVSGILAAFGGVLLAGILCGTGCASILLESRQVQIWLGTLTTFLYTLGMCQFDLGSVKQLRLTVAFTVIARVILAPILVLSAGWIMLKLGALSMTTSSSVLSAGALSGLGLCAAIPVSYAPAIAALSAHVYPTLLAQLSVVSAVLAPALALFSHGIATFCAQILPGLSNALGAAFCPVPIFLTTTAPAIAALILHRALPRRICAALAFAALPTAWFTSGVLLSVIIQSALAEPVSMLIPCLFVTLAAAFGGVLLARMMGNALQLEIRVRRTVMLYVGAQGLVLAGTVAPVAFAGTPAAAAALTGVIVCAVLAKFWSRVIIRSDDNRQGVTVGM